MVNDDVASLTSGLGSNNALGGNDLSSEGGLVLPDIDRDSGLVPVRGSLKEVLLGLKRGSVKSQKKKDTTMSKKVPARVGMDVIYLNIDGTWANRRSREEATPMSQ